MRIGVLAAQGAFIEHMAVLRRLGVEAVPVRLPGDLEGLDGLIIPGGESTTISQLLVDYKLLDRLKKLAQNGLPIFGTCAGMILLANDVPDPRVEPLGVMQIKIKRNAFGRQRESFETELVIPVLGDKPFHGVFIRAPAIEQVNNGVEILSRLADGTIVAARQGKMLVAAFHPELTDDLRFHQYFLDMVAEKKDNKKK
ncbi:MAG: pyridoxal 5'-phosphate synthase glutaminase subunit PdxT [Dehalococcoidales bacterium]|nr:pyridoxal 5'-phosphate synthase glutaminase subunit PdxT [Dehalococcoidales bacterium]